MGGRKYAHCLTYVLGWSCETPDRKLSLDVYTMNATFVEVRGRKLQERTIVVRQPGNDLLSFSIGLFDLAAVIILKIGQRQQHFIDLGHGHTGVRNSCCDSQTSLDA